MLNEHIERSAGAAQAGRQKAQSAGDIRLIALDLDGTLLNSDKALTPRNRAALESASLHGIEIVPSTGRFYRGMPEQIRELPFVNYAITINGAQVLNVKTGESLYSAGIPTDTALEVLSWLDTLPVIYDVYADGWGYITAWMQRDAEQYISYSHSIDMVRTLRSPVPDVKEFIREGRHRPQKMQLYTRDIPFRDALLLEMAEKYPDLVISTSLPNNIEINSRDAEKGLALLGLAEKLGLRRGQTMAFGDGLNDIGMIRAAGVGVVMANGREDVKAEADILAESCDDDGVAKVIEELLGDLS